MDQIQPAMLDAFRLLRQDITGYLDEAEFLATKLESWSPEDQLTVRNLVPDLTTIVRGIILDHKETLSGACQGCNNPWPCSTVRTIHGLVKSPEHEFVKIAQRAYEQRAYEMS